MYKLHFLEKENDLNRVRKEVRKAGSKGAFILFVSLWDEHCQHLVELLKEKYGDVDHEKAPFRKDLYIVNSFDMPHSFVVWDTTSVPQLVDFKRDTFKIEEYMPRIMKKLKV